MVVVVTDPLCSWCWGMARQTELAMTNLARKVDFDLLLGGVNLHATQHIGDYGKRLLFHIWREVEATTGQPFGYKLPDDLVYNSTLPAMAVRGYARHNPVRTFEFLHHLQERFFVHGENINQLALLLESAQSFDWDEAAFDAAMRSSRLKAIVRWEFENARQYGTSALPNVLLEQQGRRRLLAGGYLDAQMLEDLLAPAIATENSPQ